MLEQRIKHLASVNNLKDDIIYVNLVPKKVTLKGTLEKYSPLQLVIIGTEMRWKEFPMPYQELRKNAYVHLWPVYAPVYQEELKIEKIRVEWFDQFFLDYVVNKGSATTLITMEREFPRGNMTKPKTAKEVSKTKPKPKEVTIDPRQKKLSFG